MRRGEGLEKVISLVRLGVQVISIVSMASIYFPLFSQWRSSAEKVLLRLSVIRWAAKAEEAVFLSL